MSTVLIIGAGGVGRVTTYKCVQNSDHFSRIVLASRTLARCEAIAADLPPGAIEVAQVDADNPAETAALIRKVGADIVINVALPYQDLAIMDACIETGAAYIDTANYEHPDTAHFEYKEQWARQQQFADSGNIALLGCGFDPGVTNVFCAYALKHYFDTIETIDILDCNAGDHGYPFATNFNPEINLREVSANGRYWEEGEWIETEPMAIKMVWDYPEVGPKDSYLLYHEEMESLVENIPGLKRIRFFMTFGESYLTHMRCLENVGMLRIDEVEVNGVKVVPLQLLKALLPDPASLGPRTHGKTNIGIVASGTHHGKRRKIYIYQICDHQECYRETGAQAVSYTAGVPPALGALLLARKEWSGSGVFNIETLDPDPMMAELNRQGLPWQVVELDPDS
ncbi:MAG: saccharopine dehydrogenase family protein [Gammaproteobacteria bacterium]|nr:saccharopine dehydrogenase family protein [Gammaproteobacteria bacterium]